LVRRVENRGYATLGRLSAYFETLKAGDESNAIVEAKGCVSLMTIHAAKGLEFPIVFLVNLQTLGRGRGSSFSIIERGPAGEPEVAFGTTAATRLEDDRDEEELRRVLYVAATRARDRLYLSMEIDPAGRLKRKRGSLAALLPGGLADAIATAAVAGKSTARWESGQGAFDVRICRPDAGEHDAHAASAAPGTDPPVDRLPLRVPASVPIAATAAEPSTVKAEAPTPHRKSGAWARAVDRLVGTLVHRMFQRQLSPVASDAELREAVQRLIRADEAVDIDDEAAVAIAAVEVYSGFRRRPDVAALLAGSRAEYEVPFSFRPPGRPDAVVRGVIDCVVEGADGALTVIEFKTGAPRPEHDVQAGLYADALRAAWPGRNVDVKILYP